MRRHQGVEAAPEAVEERREAGQEVRGRQRARAPRRDERELGGEGDDRLPHVEQGLELRPPRPVQVCLHPDAQPRRRRDRQLPLRRQRLRPEPLLEVAFGVAAPDHLPRQKPHQEADREGRGRCLLRHTRPLAQAQRVCVRQRVHASVPDEGGAEVPAQRENPAAHDVEDLLGVRVRRVHLPHHEEEGGHGPRGELGRAGRGAVVHDRVELPGQHVAVLRGEQLLDQPVPGAGHDAAACRTRVLLSVAGLCAVLRVRALRDVQRTVFLPRRLSLLLGPAALLTPARVAAAHRREPHEDRERTDAQPLAEAAGRLLPGLLPERRDPRGGAEAQQPTAAAAAAAADAAAAGGGAAAAPGPGGARRAGRGG
eukprot:Rhum_TRINITY_DN10884_c0_g1::Rhum_TRINITY_DN10884_c0_g1_i1::g.40887::m.40887